MDLQTTGLVNVFSFLTIRRRDMTLSAAAAAAAIITLCHRGGEQRAEAGGQASR